MAYLQDLTDRLPAYARVRDQLNRVAELVHESIKTLDKQVERAIMHSVKSKKIGNLQSIIDHYAQRYNSIYHAMVQPYVKERQESLKETQKLRPHKGYYVEALSKYSVQHDGKVVPFNEIKQYVKSQLSKDKRVTVAAISRTLSVRDMPVDRKGNVHVKKFK